MLLAALGLSSCATPPGVPIDPLRAHSAALVGRWSNGLQWVQAPDDLRRPPAVGHPYDWLDYQEATFFRVAAPNIGTHVVYLEWRGDDGMISRQRLWSFRRDAAGAVRMDFFTLRSPEALAGHGAEGGAFAALTADDVIGYGEACALVVTAQGDNGGFIADIPTTCRITARSGRVMTLTAQVYLDNTALAYQEAGLLDDGDFAFKVPGGPPYVFLRGR